MAINKYQQLLADFDKHCLAVSRATEIKLGESEKQKHERKKTLETDYITWFEYYFPNYAKVKSAWERRVFGLNPYPLATSCVFIKNSWFESGRTVTFKPSVTLRLIALLSFFSFCIFKEF